MKLFGRRSMEDGKKDSSMDNKDVTVLLTPEGKKKAEEMSVKEPEITILFELLDSGTQTFRELSEKTNMSVNKVKEICKSLARHGYIKPLKV